MLKNDKKLGSATPKLRIRRETLRQLDAKQLVGIASGMSAGCSTRTLPSDNC